jgi:hypothetical protein
MKVRIEIELGNDAMRTGYDVSWALEWLARTLDDRVGDDELAVRDGCPIHDPNGDTVGYLEVLEA